MPYKIHMVYCYRPKPAFVVQVGSPMKWLSFLGLMVLSKIGTTVVAGGGWGKRLACNGFTEIPSELRGNPPPRLPRWILPMQLSTIYPVAQGKKRQTRVKHQPFENPPRKKAWV